MRPALQADLPAITVFLTEHIATAMFPLSNLARHGWNSDAPRGPQFWIAQSAGNVTDVLCITNEGMVMPNCPSGNWAEIAQICANRPLIGLAGDSDQCDSIITALGLENAHAGLNGREPLMQLDLVNLVVPKGDGQLVPLANTNLAQMAQWRAAFVIEAMGVDPDRAAAIGTRDVTTYLANDSHRALMIDGAPVAMTGYNATLPNTVQIGGVYTPPALRGRGYARRAVALHLQEARVKGVTRAILAAANAAARRAYDAIGFEHIGHFTLHLFKTPQVAHG
ncbi:MAG: GNAT family N-acetyltransferase [Thalassobium sp.]|nr:MAG: GNAT family N-acetyltransferase [Thalassobium sp.]